jgi:hypothetical protein
MIVGRAFYKKYERINSVQKFYKWVKNIFKWTPLGDGVKPTENILVD